MSKRFGRNQKNKLRAQVAALTQKLVLADLKVNYAEEMEAHTAGQLKELMDEFKRWWDGFILTDPKIIEIETRGKLPPYFKRALYKKDLSRALYLHRPVSDDLLTQTLQACQVVVRFGLGRDTACHIILRVGPKECAYYIEPETLVKLKGMPAQMRTFFVQEVCRALDDYILNGLCND